MTPMEILNKIVEAESNARRVFQEAESLEKGFDDYVNKHIEELRAQHFDRAEQAIAQARQQETARAEQEMEQLKERLSQELKEVARLFDSRREDIVSHIFRLVVNTDA